MKHEHNFGGGGRRPAVGISWERLMEQSSSTAQAWLLDAKESIDAAFGDGFAAENPALVAVMVSAAATDFATMAQAKLQDCL